MREQLVGRSQRRRGCGVAQHVDDGTAVEVHARVGGGLRRLPEFVSDTGTVEMKVVKEAAQRVGSSQSRCSDEIESARAKCVDALRPTVLCKVALILGRDDGDLALAGRDR